MLKVDAIESSYGTSQVLFGMTLEVNAGEVVTLMGRNGMGKTTTIRSIMGLMQPHGGSVSFEGQTISGLPSHQIAKVGIGLVPEGRQIFPNLTVRENLIATAHNLSESSDPWTLDKVLERFPSLEARISGMGNELSGGEQQMLAIARALARDLKLLLLDEPYEGLAPVIVQEIETILHEIKELGITTVIVEQNAVAALKLADRAVILDTGEVAFAGAAREVLDNAELRHEYLAI